MTVTASREASLPKGWAEEVKDFDETKAGVKGLVDAGLTNIPRIFLHPPENLPANNPTTQPHPSLPLIDFCGLDGAKRAEIIGAISEASETWGFFQVVNHGVPLAVIDDMINGVNGFFEQPKEIKMEFHTRDLRKNVRYNSNFDLYSSRAVNWRDSLYCGMAPDPFNPQELPDVFSLQILHQNQWVDVKPERGAFIVNVGDLLQLISNGRFKSVDHRVLTNGASPRVSVAFFFTTHFQENTRLYGPIKGLLSDDSPPLYRETRIKGFLTHYYTKGLDANSALDYLKL